MARLRAQVRVRKRWRLRLRADAWFSASVRVRSRIRRKVRCRAGGGFPFRDMVRVTERQALGHRCGYGNVGGSGYVLTHGSVPAYGPGVGNGVR